jgi:hypothetical protein
MPHAGADDTPVMPPEGAERAGDRHWLDPADPPHWLLILASMLIILGGLLIAVCDRGAHEELAKQYERMHGVFRSGSHQFASSLHKATSFRLTDLELTKLQEKDRVPETVLARLRALKQDQPWERQRFLEKLAEVFDSKALGADDPGEDERERLRDLVLMRTAFTLPAREVEQIQAILIELGGEAIQENAQWLLLRRSKPVELPLGA